MKIKNTRGFTLLELILVMIIIGTAFPVVMKGLYTAQIKQVDARRAQDFAYLFQEKMENLVPAGFAGVSAGLEDPVSGFDAYSRQVFVSYVDSDFAASGSETDYEKIIVRVTHRSSGGSFSGSTVLRRRE